MDYYETGQKQEIPQNYIAALFKFKWYITLSIVILCGLSVFIALIIPPTYRSEGIILVETQQIPTNLVQSTVTSIAAERIQIIKQRVMTRVKLLAIASKYPELKTDERMLASKLVSTIRDSITVELISSASNSRRNNAKTIAFTVGFEARSPELAQLVANDLITLFLSENVKSRTERATETTTFLRTEANTFKDLLDTTELAIANYKAENKDALPEHLGLYTAMLERAQNNFINIERQIDTLESQKSFFELQRSLVNSQRDPNLTGDLGGLVAIKKELQRLNTIYQPSHPDIIRLVEQVKALELTESSGIADSANGSSELYARIQSNESELKTLLLQKDKIAKQIQDTEAKILQIPQVERGLTSLSRDYETVKKQYEMVVGNTMQAQMAENLEEGRKAERFSILEPAALPELPYKPDRKLIAGAGLALSFGLPIGLILALAFFDKSVRGAAAIEIITGQQPLAVIGYIETREEITRKRRKMKMALISIIPASLVILAAVHFMYMPLDIILYKTIYRFN